MTYAQSFDTAAHRLLDELDARHDQLLLDLDALDLRVEQVLAQFRPAGSEPIKPSPARAAAIEVTVDEIAFDDDGDIESSGLRQKS